MRGAARRPAATAAASSIDEATRVARAVPLPRRARIAARGARGAVARSSRARYRGVSFDRPPVTDMPDPHVVRDRARASSRALDENLDAGRGLWFTGDVGTGKTTLAMLVSQRGARRRALGGDLLAAAPAGRDPRDLRGRRRRRPTSPSSTGWPRSTCCTSTTSAPRRRTDWVLEQLYSIVNARYEEERSIVITTNLDDATSSREQIGERTVSRLDGDVRRSAAALRRRPRAGRLRVRARLAAT